MSLSTAASAPNPWVRILDALEKKINRHSYETWLKPTRYSHANGKILVIQVPTPEFRVIGEKYADLISEAMENLQLGFEDVEFVTNEENPNAARSAPNTTLRHNGGFGPAQGGGRGGQGRFDWDSAAQLNPKYTFDNFVKGS